MQHIRSAAPPRSRLPDGSGRTIVTSILAAVSAIVLVALSGCHSAPANNAFAATTTDKAVEARLRQVGTMPPLQPFDEHFVEIPADDAAQ